MRNIVLSNSTFKVIIMNLISYYMIHYCCQEFTNSSCFFVVAVAMPNWNNKFVELWSFFVIFKFEKIFIKTFRQISDLIFWQNIL